MNKDDIIEKIKKLLRMKRGGTPGEIENALAMAAELARKHGIDLGSVNPDEEKTERITHYEEVLKSRLPAEAKFALAICVNFFNVQACITPAINLSWLRRPAKVTLVGTNWDIQISRYIFAFLQRHFRYCWNHRENKRLRNRNAFMHGMFLGLAHKLDEARKSQLPGEGLVLIGAALQRRKDYLAKLFPNMKDKDLAPDDSDAWASKRAGAIAGRNTEIRSALNKAPAPARPALPPAAGQLAFL